MIRLIASMVVRARLVAPAAMLVVVCSAATASAQTTLYVTVGMWTDEQNEETGNMLVTGGSHAYVEGEGAEYTFVQA